MQAMNLHPAQQDILLNLLNVQMGQAQGLSKQPQGELSFSSMLEHADKTYSTEGKNTQKSQDSSPKAETLSNKEDKSRESMSVRSEKTDDQIQKSESNDEMNSEDKVLSEEKVSDFDITKANAEIDRFTVKEDEDAVSGELLKNGETGGMACLTMPDSDEVIETEAGEKGIENGLSSIKNDLPQVFDAESLKIEAKNEKGALSVDADIESSSESANKIPSKDEDAELSFEKKAKKKTTVSDGNEAVQITKAADTLTDVQQPVVNAEQASIAAVHAKADGAAQQESRIEIIDERTHAESADVTLNTTTVLNADGSSAEMVMTLPVQAAGADANGSVESGYTKADFSQMLNNSLAATKDDLVKTGSIILQDNKKGSINLILHPEELGNVKVKLELSDNQITGKIVVASKEAYDAFKQNLEDIRNAFVANGFDACGFDLAWAGTGDSNGSQGQNPADNGSGNQFGLQYFGTVYEDNISDSVPEYYAENSHINLVA